ncbi:MAG: thioredoxin [Candidatus Diapherotrites archaeon CG09_land_8_20_14_0_10_32_12]|nr:MAG: thioredoxin [Candidatus Diapherotrites archaeon CG09_land_8_20_14_0_10_32_12]
MHIEVNDSNFDKEVIEKSKDKYILVDFWAPWCMPCLMLAPNLEKIASLFEDKLVFVKVNVDENSKLGSKYKIMSIPSVKLFKDGNVIDEFVGSLPEQGIRDFLKKNIK